MPFASSNSAIRINQELKSKLKYFYQFFFAFDAYSTFLFKLFRLLIKILQNY